MKKNNKTLFSALRANSLLMQLFIVLSVSIYCFIYGFAGILFLDAFINNVKALVSPKVASKCCDDTVPYTPPVSTQKIEDEGTKDYSLTYDIINEFTSPELVIFDDENQEIVNTIGEQSYKYYFYDSYLKNVYVHKDFLYFVKDGSIFRYNLETKTLELFANKTSIIKNDSNCLTSSYTKVEFKIVQDTLFAWPYAFSYNYQDENSNPCNVNLYIFDLNQKSTTPKHTILLTSLEDSDSYFIISDKISIINNVAYIDVTLGHYENSPEMLITESVITINLSSGAKTELAKFIYPGNEAPRFTGDKDLLTATSTLMLGLVEENNTVYLYTSDISFYCSSNCKYDNQEGYFSHIYLNLKKQDLKTGETKVIRSWNKSDYIYYIEILNKEILIEEKNDYLVTDLDGKASYSVAREIDNNCIYFNITDYPEIDIEFYYQKDADEDEDKTTYTYKYDPKNKTFTKEPEKNYDDGSIYEDDKEYIDKKNEELGLDGDIKLKLIFRTQDYYDSQY